MGLNMTDDRWTRMCRDAFGHLATPDEYGITYVNVGKSGSFIIHDWTVDELMSMYIQYMREKGLGIEVQQYSDYDDYDFSLIAIYPDDAVPFTSDYSWKDCWLQLVMWDKHKMTWNDEQSKWVKG
jgi:hypothetical protein